MVGHTVVVIATYALFRQRNAEWPRLEYQIDFHLATGTCPRPPTSRGLGRHRVDNRLQRHPAPNRAHFRRLLPVLCTVSVICHSEPFNICPKRSDDQSRSKTGREGGQRKKKNTLPPSRSACQNQNRCFVRRRVGEKVWVATPW